MGFTMLATKPSKAARASLRGSVQGAAAHSVPSSRLQFGRSPRSSSRLMGDAALPPMSFVRRAPIALESSATEAVLNISLGVGALA